MWHLKSGLDKRHRDRLVFTLCFIGWKHVGDTKWLELLVEESTGDSPFKQAREDFHCLQRISVPLELEFPVFPTHLAALYLQPMSGHSSPMAFSNTLTIRDTTNFDILEGAP